MLHIEGQQEVIDGLPSQEQPRSNIDQMIEALAQERRINGTENDEEANAQQQLIEDQVRQIASPRSGRSGLRRVGDVVGVRQSSGNWQRDNTTPWNKPILARPLNAAVLETQYKQT